MQMLASFAGDNQFKSIYSFIVLFIFVATLFGQLHWIAKRCLLPARTVGWAHTAAQPNGSGTYSVLCRTTG